ncbi:hypothetical protein [Puia dinghuensis]|uniref:hypothetical protein n=1 Tax=Puia dinghuensis TaxID=1792502 RepID=UPI001E328394|nr:hypothetical protein [Puia dinghuensis]
MTLPLATSSQHLLDRIITIRVRRLPLAQVLDSIAHRADVEFSYNSRILPGDSPVTCSFVRVTVQKALDSLLGKHYTYIEQGRYVIILPYGTANAAEDKPPDAQAERIYTVTGVVLDSTTRRGIANASVYAKAQLQSALTDSQGYFKLRLKTRFDDQALTVSKEWYGDTDVVVHPGYDQSLTILIASVNPSLLAPATVNGVERSKFVRFFLSYRQRMQSLNLAHFFTSRQTQVSLLPWLGTHGSMSGQVTNVLSLNIIGGYGAGLNGVEMGGVFNIDKKNVRAVQLAGVMNLTGGEVHGVEAAGLLNRAVGSVKGVQLAGGGNMAMKNMSGVQVAGDFNLCRDTARGLQLSAFENRARVLKGVQIGLFNFADTSTGYSLGLVSIIKHGGVHRLTLSTSRVTGLTIEYIQGNQKLNSIFMIGYNPLPDEHNFSYGFGLGKALPFSPHWGMYGEITAQHLFTTDWKDFGSIYRARPLFTWRIARKISLFAGPSFTIYVAPSTLPASTNQVELPGAPYITAFRGGRTSAWIDGDVGISFF